MRHSSPVMTALCSVILLAGCEPRSEDSSDTTAASDSADFASQQRAAEEIIARFGSRMKMVSLLAPDSAVAAAVREAYGELVTRELLSTWMEQPTLAPGRRVSSPWPARIEVETVRQLADNLIEVTGDVVYVTSVERSQEGSDATEPVRLRVTRRPDGSWRISEYAEGTESKGG